MKHVPACMLLFSVALGLGVLVSHAQLTGAEPLTLTLNPSYPRPYQTVTIVPQSSTIDLTSSVVTISVNGTVVTKGSGAEPAYVTVGGPGTATTVTVTAVTSGQTYTKSVTIRPADVALVVEPQSTTHPFYEGSSLTASEGGVRLVAIPDLRTSGGARVPAANLVYTWKNGEQILQSSSGIGKSVLAASAPVRYRDSLITVTVTTQDRSIVAEASAFVSPTDPVVQVYRNDPLLGPLFGTALPSTIVLADAEESFRVVPYYFSERPQITWEVNNLPADTDQDITVRASGSGSGTARLNVLAKSPSSLQAVGGAFSVTFGEERPLGIFGL